MNTTKSRIELRCSGRVISYWFTSETRGVTDIMNVVSLYSVSRLRTFFLSVVDNNRPNSLLNGNMTGFALPLFYNVCLRFSSMELHNACHYILKTDCYCTLTIGYDFGFAC